jgi:uncharacterized protein (TIGR03435 family)
MLSVHGRRAGVSLLAALLLASALGAAAQQHFDAGAAASAALTGAMTSSEQGTDAPLSPAAQEIIRKARFEVAAIHLIKDNDPQHVSISIHRSPDGNFIASGVTVRLLLSLALGMDESRIQGGPAWITEDRFTIAAKPNEALGKQLATLNQTALKQAYQKMFTDLFADRLALKTHWATVQKPVIALEVAKNGSKLHSSDKDDSYMDVGNGTLHATRATLDALASFLTQQLHQIVQNQTGLKGFYDLTLDWNPDNGDAATADKPALPTAVEEQLGLKLASRKAPVEVLVIDKIEKPSGN